MKKQILFLVWLFFFSAQIKAQTGSSMPCCDPAVCGGLNCDSGWTTSSHLPYLMSIHQADVLSGLSIPQSITPTGPKICFDKVMKIESSANSETLITCVFLNTKTGLIAYTQPQKHDPGICDIKADDPHFLLNVISLKGNTFTYRNNRKPNGVIEHWVQTANSETYQYQFAGTGHGGTTVQRKAERRSYCDNKVKAQLYKVDGRSEEWFLFGKIYPEQIILQEKKFLGSMAVGYQYTDKGLYIIMQMTGGGFNSRILDMNDQLICFETGGFQVFEDVQQTEVTASIHRERDRIQRDAAKPEKYEGCQQKKNALISFRTEALNKREQNLQQARRGNTQQDPAAMKAQAELMNYDDMLEQLRLETELKYCRAQADQAERPSASTQNEINCLSAQLANIRNVQAKFREIDTRHRGQEALKKIEKSKQFMQVLTPCE